MYHYLEESKPFIVSTFVGIVIILLFGIDCPSFGNQIATEKERTTLLE